MRFFAAPVSSLAALAVSCAVGATFVLARAVVMDPNNLPRRAWERHCASIERRLYKMFIFTAGYRVVLGQLIAAVLVTIAALVLGFPQMVYLGLLFVCGFGPEVWMARKLSQRLSAIEKQVDGFMLALANSLKSRPNIGDALASIQPILANPLRQEVELAVKQMRVGSSLEQALIHMSGRIGSRQLDAALSAVLIGRQVGGNVPHILETTAASMREMARLEGVVRAKTAEGKAQIWVLAAFPFVLMVTFSLASPGYFDPLTTSFTGYVCTAIAFALWGASIVGARKILSVDL